LDIDCKYGIHLLAMPAPVAGPAPMRIASPDGAILNIPTNVLDVYLNVQEVKMYVSSKELRQ
jgi:hypothetical protein